MIGDRYWSTGIVVDFIADDSVSVRLDFCDDGFCDVDATEGTLSVRYQVADLSRAVTVLHADAVRFGVTFSRFQNRVLSPTVYVDENRICEYPAGWAERIRAECDRLGWEFIYSRHLAAVLDA